MVLPNSSIFISYRKDDSAGWSAKLADDLRTILGDDAVFIDDSIGIPFGTQWPDQISMALSQCRVFLPVIAPSWHQATNLNRLKEPNDWVRQELITTHSRRSSVLCIPVFVNEAHILRADQFSSDPELQKVIGDLMTDQGIQLDRGTEYWPDKIASLISRIEVHLGISIPQSDSTFTTDDSEQSDSSASTRLPAIQWLHDSSTWLSAVGAIAAVIALVPIFFGSPEPSVDNTVHMEGDNQGSQIAGGNITNVGDPQDEKTIASQRQTIRSHEETIANLIKLLPAGELSTNEKAREEITDAVIGLSDLGSEPLKIDQAETALAQGDTELAQALYKEDADKKAVAGEAQLHQAAESYRRLGALASLDNTASAIDAYQNAVKAWPDDLSSWNQLGHLYRRIGQNEQAIGAYRNVQKLAGSTENLKLWTAISIGNLGLVYWNRGELGRAEEMYEKALAINMELDREEGIASQYGNLGLVYLDSGEIDKAEEMFKKALTIDNELGREERVAKNYGHLGVVYRKRGELDRAEEMYEKSLAINIDLGYKEGLADQYGNLGVVYQQRQEFERSIAMHKKSLEIHTKLGKKKGMANTYANLGMIHLKQSDLDKARLSWERSAELYEEINSPMEETVLSWIADNFAD